MQTFGPRSIGWSRSGPIYDARADPDNYPVIRAMIDQGFLTGDSTRPEPRITATTWKVNDLYMATNREGVRIRLACKIGSTLDIEAIHRFAVALHAEFGDRWNRRESGIVESLWRPLSFHLAGNSDAVHFP